MSAGTSTGGQSDDGQTLGLLAVGLAAICGLALGYLYARPWVQPVLIVLGGAACGFVFGLARGLRRRGLLEMEWRLVLAGGFVVAVAAFAVAWLSHRAARCIASTGVWDFPDSSPGDTEAPHLFVLPEPTSDRIALRVYVSERADLRLTGVSFRPTGRSRWPSGRYAIRVTVIDDAGNSATTTLSVSRAAMTPGVSSSARSADCVGT